MESLAAKLAKERRRSLRFDLNLPVHIFKVRNETVEIDAETFNLSSVGAYFPFDDELAPGIPVEFLVTLPPATKTEGHDVLLHCRGHVARADSLEGTEQFGIATTIDRYQFVRQAADKLSS